MSEVLRGTHKKKTVGVFWKELASQSGAQPANAEPRTDFPFVLRPRQRPPAGRHLCVPTTNPSAARIASPQLSS